MRILTFNGKYSYRKDEEFIGIVCFIHFEPKDAEETAKKAIKTLLEEFRGQSLGLVPFAHLYEAVLDNEKAQELFEFMKEIVDTETGENTFVAPFGISKDLRLSVTSDDSFVRFFHF